jgi:hypothetical protein
MVHGMIGPLPQQTIYYHLKKKNKDDALFTPFKKIS